VGGIVKRYRLGSALKLHLKKIRLHEDVGKAPGAKITDADIAKEKVVMAEQIIAPTKLDYAEDAK
jgi:hypothetical protein